MHPTRIALSVGLASSFVALASAGQPSAPDTAVDARFDGHKVVRVDIRTPEQLQTMLRLSPDPWFCEARPGPLDFRVPPEALPALDASGLRYTVFIDNVQALIDAERDRLRGPVVRGGWFTDYKDYAAVDQYVDTLVALRPDLVSRIDLGASLEGRPIFGVRIANDAAGGGRCKPGIFLHSCQHAREWISVMVNMYLADALVRRYDTDPVVRDLVDRCEFFVVPISNPDGYVYSWTTNRLWRKNRRNNGNGTFGVDTNRNWGYQWGVSLPHGSAGNANPGSDVYWGASPFSEPEDRALRDFVLSHVNIRTDNDIHSYGPYILWPWGYSPNPSPDQSIFNAVGTAMQQTIQGVHGVRYTAGPLYTTLYPVSGGSIDWHYGARGVYSYSYELRGNPGGFVLPPDQIIPNGEEVLPAALQQARWAADQFPYLADWNHDCAYSVADFLAFLNDFASGAPACDIDGDGSVNVGDFLAFLSAYGQGR
jgi:hypothetical protein